MVHKKRILNRNDHYGGYYSPLSENAVQEIHNTSMDVFEQVGVKITYQPVLDLWKQAGADIDSEKMVARLDRKSVATLLAKAPQEITLCGRNEKNDIILSGTRTHMGTGGTALNILDLFTRERRPTNIYDVAATARIVDACDNIDFFVITCYPNEFTKSAVDINRFYAAINNTSKHIMGGIYTLDGIRQVAKMAEMIAGSKEAFRARPFISMITSVMSPLRFDNSYTELMETVCKLGIPVAPSTAPMAGSTSPVTLAGTLVQMNVEALAGIITTQLIDPGHPTLYSVVPTTTDLRTGTFCFGSIEMGMMNAAAAQLARFYKLPMYNTAGPSEAKVLDVQAAYETAMNILLSGLAGANYIHESAGMLESGLTISPEGYIVNNEIIGMVNRVLQGIEVDEERLALDCIKRVGPGGNYLGDEATLKYMRNEMFYPEVADRKPRMVWEDEGRLTAEEHARILAIKCLKEHKPDSIDLVLDKKIREEFPAIGKDTGAIYQNVPEL